jgi:ABC-type antimicrobial peptide transport system permease subunit
MNFVSKNGVQLMLSYAIKRIIRSFGLFAALLLGVALASTFFAGVNVGADTTAKAALNQQLSKVAVDIVIGSYNLRTSTVWTSAVSNVVNVSGVTDAEVISRASWWGNTTFENHTSLRIVGISNASLVYDGLTVTSGVNSLGENETYVWAGSKNADKIELNSSFAINFTYWVPGDYPQNEKTISLPLKAVGFVELDNKAYNIATGEIWYSPTPYQPLQEKPQATYGENLFIVDWEETIAKFLDTLSSDVSYYNNPFTTQIFAYVDRDALINPWDISASLQAVQMLTTQVNQAVVEYGMYANNNLEQVLMIYQFNSMTMRFSFLIVALPVFFVAWYVGTTVSDVSYNLRRREIGLLLTKGFSTGQLFRMFLTESIMIGIIGGLIGIGLGYVLSPFFVAAAGGELGTTPVLSLEVIIIAIIFSLAITLLSTFRPSRRASKLAAVDALREYMYVEEVKPYKQRWTWVAFALGTYKIVMFIFGIDLFQIFTTRPMPSSNIIIVIILGIWIFLDYFILNNIGPLLFFWGFTKIFIRGSLKFQELVTRAARFLGDLGALATRNVQRNPARAASVAFLIALIIGYSFQTVGTVASEQDYIIRQVKASVGADISVEPISPDNVSQITSAIEALSGVASTTLEYSFSGTLPGQYYSMQLKAVDPEKWLSTAYYENEWFSGNDIATTFQQMKMNNQTIILELNTAKSLAKKVGDNVTLIIESLTPKLTIVGFFGREVTQQYYAFWSYVPIGFYKSLNLDWYPSVKILVKLEPSADGESVASEIWNQMRDNVSSVHSVAEELKTYQTNLQLTGPLNIQRIGVIFSILAASVATGLVTLVSLQERKREASIMSARGLSFKQLVTMFLAENLAIIVFAAIIGIAVGLIVVHGHVAASNATIVSYSLVTHRMVFPSDSIILLSTCLILVFASALIPLILLIKRYISKIERIVRL